MEIVEVPTFLCKGEHIVEVMFTEFYDTGIPGRWGLVHQTEELKLPEDIDRVVFEFPDMCADMPVKLGSAGTGFVLAASAPGRGYTPQRCERLHGYDLEEGVVSETVQA